MEIRAQAPAALSGRGAAVGVALRESASRRTADGTGGTFAEKGAGSHDSHCW